ncbi:uncharacterized protein LOC132703449 [Cylas formicarius]|uniref:uncharacterized protein LOC132703449 n=1 Tax=Cylas formicarius TaxID=197179 RepID=UPI002958B0CC|nr:uncharacterized protein LOC132703449 [Cylas formicarius]
MMKVNVLYITNILILLFMCVLTYTVAEEDGEIETIHESYRPRHKGSHPRRSGRRKHGKRSAFSDQCAIMYKNEEPVGILEPFGESYRLLPVDGQKIDVEISPVTKRKKSTSADDAYGDARDTRYPYIFAKFKIDSRMEKNAAGRKQRSARVDNRKSLFDSDQLNSLQRALSKVKSGQGKADSDIRSVLSDLGLVDGAAEVEKRDADKGKKKKQEKSSAVKRSERAKKSDEARIDLLDEQSDREKREQMEAELEGQIKAKLAKIKDEVKREIEEMKSGAVEEQDANKQRKKRFASSTLIDEETSDIDPVLNVDEKLRPYRRRRRNVAFEGLENVAPSRVLLRNIKQADADDYVENADSCGEGGKCPPKGQRKSRENDDYDVDVDAPARLADEEENYDDDDGDGDIDDANPMLEDGKYRLDIRPDVYRVKSETFEDDAGSPVEKRNAPDAIDIDEPQLRHLIAVRGRTMLPRDAHARSRRMTGEEQQLRLEDMPGEDLFGPLQHGFDAERVRYKRVKRNDKHRRSG